MQGDEARKKLACFDITNYMLLQYDGYELQVFQMD